MKIIIVEDEQFILDGINSLIINNVDFPIKIKCVIDSKTAVQQIKDFKPDLLITDIVMPEINGLDIIKSIKDENINIEIIVISAHDEFTYAQKALRLGVTDYLMKPIDKERLLDSLHKINKTMLYNKCIKPKRQLPNFSFLKKITIDEDCPESIKRIIKYLNLHYAENISLSEIGSRFYLNSSYISSMFSKNIGISFIQYINHLRLSKAVELIIYESEMSIYEISYAVGYFNERKIYRAFNKYLGVTPGEIRRSFGII